MASVLDRPDRIVISTSVHQAGKTSKCGPEKIKKLTQDVWKEEHCASVSSSCREPWDILIGGECAAETVLPGLVGPLPAGNSDGTLFCSPSTLGDLACGSDLRIQREELPILVLTTYLGLEAMVHLPELLI